jgi:hypothetical protein
VHQHIPRKHDIRIIAFSDPGVPSSRLRRLRAGYEELPDQSEHDNEPLYVQSVQG